MPGRAPVFTSDLRHTSILISEDFPALERPKNANSGKFPAGQPDGFAALFRNSALRISITGKKYTKAGFLSKRTFTKRVFSGMLLL